MAVPAARVCLQIRSRLGICIAFDERLEFQAERISFSTGMGWS